MTLTFIIFFVGTPLVVFWLVLGLAKGTERWMSENLTASGNYAMIANFDAVTRQANARRDAALAEIERITNSKGGRS